jgi:hypothetical protein
MYAAGWEVLGLTYITQSAIMASGDECGKRVMECGGKVGSVDWRCAHTFLELGSASA